MFAKYAAKGIIAIAVAIVVPTIVVGYQYYKTKKNKTTTEETETQAGDPVHENKPDMQETPVESKETISDVEFNELLEKEIEARLTLEKLKRKANKKAKRKQAKKEKRMKENTHSLNPVDSNDVVANTSTMGPIVTEVDNGRDVITPPVFEDLIPDVGTDTESTVNTNNNTDGDELDAHRFMTGVGEQSQKNSERGGDNSHTTSQKDSTASFKAENLQELSGKSAPIIPKEHTFSIIEVEIY